MTRSFARRVAFDESARTAAARPRSCACSRALWLRAPARYGVLGAAIERYGDVTFWLSWLSAASAICTQPLSQRCGINVGVPVVCAIPTELSKAS